MIIRYVLPTVLSLSKSSGQNVSLLWNIYTCEKSVLAKLTLKLHKKIKKLYMLGFYKAIYQNVD